MHLLYQILFLLLNYCFFSSTVQANLCVCVGEVYVGECMQCDANFTSLHGVLKYLDGKNASESVHIILLSPQNTTVKSDSYSKQIFSCHQELYKFFSLGSHSGFKFVNVTGVLLQNIEIDNCGAAHNSSSVNITANSTNFIFKSSVYILNSSNISIINVNIRNSDGTGLTSNIFVHIENCRFDNNTIKSRGDVTSTIPGGGG